MELVHDHDAEVASRLSAPRDIREDFGDAAEDGGAAFTAASPVIILTLSDPNTVHSAKNFSLTRALIGAACTPTGRQRQARSNALAATSDSRIRSGWPARCYR
jgi:hypothetical protein